MYIVGEYASFCGLYPGKCRCDIHLEALGKRSVRQSYEHVAVSIDGSRLAQRGNSLGCVGVLNVAVYQVGILVLLVEVEYVVGRGLDGL